MTTNKLNTDNATVPAVSYRDGDPKGWGGDPSRGAAVGRRTLHGAPSFTGRLTFREVAVGPDGYDQCGTYWGTGPRLYWYASDDGEIQGTVRALDAQHAVARIRESYPAASVVSPDAPSEDDVEACAEGYIAAMLWLTNSADAGVEDADSEHLDGLDVELAPEAREKITAMCRSFLTANMPAIGSEAHTAGHCLYLDSSGHGSGFSDWWNDTTAEALQTAARKVRPAYPYVQDGLVYLD